MSEQTPPQPAPGKVTKPADGIFVRHEPAYAEWLAANRQGFVFLRRTSCMHRAGCWRVQPLRRPESWPGFMVGGAWVSRGTAPLDYALTVIGERADRCLRCKPGSGAEGVSMMAEYLRRMRGLPPSG